MKNNINFNKRRAKSQNISKNLNSNEKNYSENLKTKNIFMKKDKFQPFFNERNGIGNLIEQVFIDN